MLMLCEDGQEYLQHNSPFEGLYREFKQASDKERVRLVTEMPGGDNVYTRIKLLEKYESDWFVNRGYLGLPPEEEACSTCDGNGVIENRISLEEALKELGYNSEALNSGDGVYRP